MANGSETQLLAGGQSLTAAMKLRLPLPNWPTLSSSMAQSRLAPWLAMLM